MKKEKPIKRKALDKNHARVSLSLNIKNFVHFCFSFISELIKFIFFYNPDYIDTHAKRRGVFSGH